MAEPQAAHSAAEQKRCHSHNETRSSAPKRVRWMDTSAPHPESQQDAEHGDLSRTITAKAVGRQPLEVSVAQTILVSQLKQYIEVRHGNMICSSTVCSSACFNWPEFQFG